MCIASIGPVRVLVGEVAKLIAPEALELAEVPRITMTIVGVRLAVGRIVIIILHKDDSAWRRT